MKAGEHLMRMTVGAFRYIFAAVDKGEILFDFEVPKGNPVKRAAKQISEA